MLLVTLDDATSGHLDKLSSIISSEMPVHYTKVSINNNQIDLKDVQVWITYGHDITPEVLEQMPNLQWIQIFQAGVEHIPFGELENRNIQLTNMKGIQTIPMAEYALSMMLYLMGNISQYLENQKKSKWDHGALFHEINGKHVSIFGAGTIGTEIAKLCKNMKMLVSGVNTSGIHKEPFDQMYRLEDREEILGQSDFVVMLLPETTETTHCISRREFEVMKESSFLINMGRGPLVHEEALIEALKDKAIAGAVLDVCNEEPLPPNHPFWSTENLIITPHVAAKSPRYLDRCIETFEKNFKSYLNNDSLQFLVNLEKGY
ncbi:D-2-hydroxyacid dehydrogenase [Bacillus carboniphilus]|uniref:D-2-hydroxyacid dehydrogenase n=1 Tax=Bacillus carboniphilus TaxID=86663 RepID=A0ABN0W5M2_9BACI